MDLEHKTTGMYSRRVPLTNTRPPTGLAKTNKLAAIANGIYSPLLHFQVFCKRIDNKFLILHGYKAPKPVPRSNREITAAQVHLGSCPP